MLNKIREFFNKERGQGLVEYGLILALISVVSIGAVSTVGNTAKAQLYAVGDALVLDGGSDEDAEYQWVRLNTDHTYRAKNERGKGYYRYNGSEKEVTVPTEINGHTMTSYAHMFRETDVEKVISDNKNINYMGYMFAESTAETLDVSELDTSNVTYMGAMFYDIAASELDVSSMDTSSAVDMSWMFRKTKIKDLDVSTFNTSKVKHMNYMFGESAIENLNVSTFDTSQLIQMNHMFHNVKAPILDLSSFDTSKVIEPRNFSSVFLGATTHTVYARNEADAERLRNTTFIPNDLVIKVR